MKMILYSSKTVCCVCCVCVVLCKKEYLMMIFDDREKERNRARPGCGVVGVPEGCRKIAKRQRDRIGLFGNSSREREKIENTELR